MPAIFPGHSPPCRPDTRSPHRANRTTPSSLAATCNAFSMRFRQCRRDPLETCLGCYRYIFMQHPYAHKLADLASHWRDFDRAAKHWQAAYPDRVRVQVYEDLVADPNMQIRELLAFCGLPFEEACL